MHFNLSKMTGEDDRGYTEMPRTGNFPVSRTMPIQLGNPFLRPYYMVSSYNTVAQQHQITGFLGLQNTPSCSDYTRTAGYGSRSIHPSKHVLFSGARGNFTQSQIIELDKQFWIAKHLMENEALPSHLLNYLYGSTRTFSVGSGSNNAKPGRCRRRDGKKWRCSRNVIQQQKFCWEHKYRAQTHYRSRKLVDGPTHQALTGPTNSNVVMPPITFYMSTSTGGGASTLQPCATIPFADAIVIREDVSCERVEDRPHNLFSLVPGLGSSDSHSSFLLNSESNVDEFLIDLILSDDEESQDQESHHNSKMDEFFIDLTLSDEETQDQESRHKSNDELESSMINWPDNFDTEWT